MRRCLRRSILALALATPVSAADVAFVHVEGNVGGASGGHAALRLGDVAFHAQVGADRLLHLEREDWRAFRFRYGTLENRPIHVATIEVPDEVRARLRDGFDAAYLSQERDFARLAALRADRELLEALAGVRAGFVGRGAGLLDSERSGNPHALELRRRVALALGPGFLDEQLAHADALLRAARSEPAPASGATQWAARLRAALLERSALLALARAEGLAPDAIVAPDPAPARLTTDERAALEAFQHALGDWVVALLRSGRPDRGFPLLLAIARHQVVARSLVEGRLLLLDPFPDASPTLDPSRPPERRRELEALERGLSAHYREQRERFLAATRPDERLYQRLEVAGGRSAEIRRALRSGRPLRDPAAARLPQRGRLLVPAVVELRPTDLAATLEALRRAERRAEQDLGERYAYDLIDRNCVTEIVRGVHAALGGRAHAAALLALDLDPDAGLGFVPFVFFARVVAELPAVRVERIASHRERELARRYRHGSRPFVYLREINTLTSSIYEARDRDGSFLLFSSGARWPRPLFGALNVTVGTIDTLAGVLTAPFDRGRRVRRGARGVLFSLPELLFVNIRKGSFDAASLPEPRAATHR